MKFNSRHTFKKKDHVISESNTKPSMTVPDEALPLKTLLQRHTRGMDVTMFQGVYSMDNDDDLASIIPEFDKMDRIERLHFAAELRQIIIDKRIELEGIENAKKAKEFNEKARREIEEAAEALAAKKIAEQQGEG